MNDIIKEKINKRILELYQKKEEIYLLKECLKNPWNKNDRIITNAIKTKQQDLAVEFIESSFTSILEIITHQMKNEMFSLKNIEKEEKCICKICFDKKVEIAIIPCGHTFCENCIFNSKSCPMCRSDIKSKLKIFLE